MDRTMNAFLTSEHVVVCHPEDEQKAAIEKLRLAPGLALELIITPECPSGSIYFMRREDLPLNLLAKATRKG